MVRANQERKSFGHYPSSVSMSKVLKGFKSIEHLSAYPNDENNRMKI
jgi:hypothetical protein